MKPEQVACGAAIPVAPVDPETTTPGTCPTCKVAMRSMDDAFMCTLCFARFPKVQVDKPPELGGLSPDAPTLVQDRIDWNDHFDKLGIPPTPEPAADPSAVVFDAHKKLIRDMPGLKDGYAEKIAPLVAELMRKNPTATCSDAVKAIESLDKTEVDEMLRELLQQREELAARDGQLVALKNGGEKLNWKVRHKEPRIAGMGQQCCRCAQHRVFRVDKSDWQGYRCAACGWEIPDIDCDPEGRANVLAEFARQAGIWTADQDLKAGCPCPSCNVGHLSFDVTSKTLVCVHGLRPGCGCRFSKAIVASLQLKGPIAIVRAMMLSQTEEPNTRLEWMRVSHAIGAAFECELLSRPPIQVAASYKSRMGSPPLEQLEDGERVLCNFDGTWLIVRARPSPEKPAPERRKSPRYTTPAFLNAERRTASMATLGELENELRKVGLSLADMRVSPEACQRIYEAVRKEAVEGQGCLMHHATVPLELHVGPWFVHLGTHGDRFGRDSEWEEERERRQVAEDLRRRRNSDFRDAMLASIDPAVVKAFQQSRDAMMTDFARHMGDVGTVFEPEGMLNRDR